MTADIKAKSEMLNFETLPLDHILKSRGWMYNFLAKYFYKEPDFKALEKLMENNLFQTLKELGEDHEGIKILADFIHKSPKLSDEEKLSIKRQYETLFYGPGHLPAPPWESVYRSDERIILDEHTLAVREFYRKWGVKLSEEDKQPDDHIGLELEFISILNKRTIEALEESDIEKAKEILNGQKTFLEKHLLIWIDEFCGMLKDNVNIDLYKGMALFTPYYLKMDRHILEELITQIDEFQK
ncbi:TorD/DmsD family molecular chaperone [Alkaliphilus sp. B6464]|uniref:TorD/DmsD family molecular chaperone n=1 Tax=Alkaliphilus sp. B6464 TaxID=2731219 RepID=UPI001BADCA6C|nr:molecular chaperone TorD family protein [Alkaliphilus sp. B6464]QUH19923.1 molecular chaperone TorD family protein [Alkaliphilus sp. B6464]